MPYVKTMVCLANSFKIGGSCIAGKERLADGTYGDWIRPVSDRESAEVSYAECRYENYMVPKLLDIVGIPLLKPLPRGHQTENHVIGKSSLWAKVGALPWRGLEDICDRPASLWMNGSQTKTGGLNNCISSAGAAALRTSLALVKPERFSVEVGSKTWDGKTTKTYWAISTTTASATF